MNARPSLKKIAVASRTFSQHPTLRKELLEKYPQAKFNDAGISLKGKGLIDYLEDADGAILALEPIDNDILSALPNLKVIGKFGVGFDKIDLQALINHKVHLGWTGGVNKRAVSELALCMMISLLRHVDISGREIRSGDWKLRPGRELSSQTVGIIGCGHVGKDLVYLLKAFGCRILVTDINPDHDFYTHHKITHVDLDTLVKSADIISLHTPLNENTRNLISAEKLKLMKESSILINTARGGLVDEDALKISLQRNQIAGAAFDVFASEPPEDIELLQLSNFLVTPHIGGSAADAILAMGRGAIDGLENNRVPEIGVYPV
ncbi:phosphoglycerate dehydrogenase [Kiloniella laminariae]|uniref:Phosphoglycerate dehydrogenase n=1 Tax=Kiloniella laminariae TaxID=454162 RepID=A0ABT4LMJ4_9PROT|nr:phosphoglycerate dehydrogenase [Kiloniella laminariae]MCZ4282328.1 phosphoglycerate dehydrogenase [Kiloniella laminariae]